MLSVVVHAELPDEDPPALTDIELYMFFSLLFAAGSETTRNAIAGGLLAISGVAMTQLGPRAWAFRTWKPRSGDS